MIMGITCTVTLCLVRDIPVLSDPFGLSFLSHTCDLFIPVFIFTLRVDCPKFLYLFLEKKFPASPFRVKAYLSCFLHGANALFSTHAMKEILLER